MTDKLKEELCFLETDLEGVYDRFSGDEELYLRCLEEFMEDTSVKDLGENINMENWDEVFTSAHALKGMVGNMGFVPLYHELASFVVSVRTGHKEEINNRYNDIYKNYCRLIDVLENNLDRRNRDEHK